MGTSPESGSPFASAMLQFVRGSVAPRRAASGRRRRPGGGAYDALPSLQVGGGLFFPFFLNYGGRPSFFQNSLYAYDAYDDALPSLQVGRGLFFPFFLGVY